MILCADWHGATVRACGHYCHGQHSLGDFELLHLQAHWCIVL
jgi:hypothetical protein